METIKPELSIRLSKSEQDLFSTSTGAQDQSEGASESLGRSNRSSNGCVGTFEGCKLISIWLTFLQVILLFMFMLIFVLHLRI